MSRVLFLRRRGARTLEACAAIPSTKMGGLTMAPPEESDDLSKPTAVERPARFAGLWLIARWVAAALMVGAAFAVPTLIRLRVQREAEAELEAAQAAA